MPFLLTIGEILVEIMATTKGDGFREPQPLVGPFPSGAPAIFIDQVGRLGHPCGIVSAVGDDDFGRLNLERLARDGVDVSAVAVHRDIATGSAFVRYRTDGSRDFVYNIAGSANGRIGRTPEAERLIERADHLHVMGTALSIPGIAALTEHAIEACARAWRHDLLRPERPQGAARRSEPWANGLARHPGAHAHLPALGRRDPRLRPRPPTRRRRRRSSSARACARSSSSGAPRGPRISTRPGGPMSPGLAVEEVDPTGAGDCFGATFLVCRSAGMRAGARARLRQCRRRENGVGERADGGRRDLRGAGCVHGGNEEAPVMRGIP